MTAENTSRNGRSEAQRDGSILGVERGANAWRILRDREHIVVLYADLDDCCGGGQIIEYPEGHVIQLDDGDILDVGGRRVIFLDHRLEPVERHAVLMHELVHDELDMLWPPDTAQAVVEAGERIVRAKTADALVPPTDLKAWINDRDAVGDPVQVGDVATRWCVPVAVADDALTRLDGGWPPSQR